MALTTVAELRSTLGVGTLYPDATLGIFLGFFLEVSGRKSFRRVVGNNMTELDNDGLLGNRPARTGE